MQVVCVKYKKGTLVKIKSRSIFDKVHFLVSWFWYTGQIVRPLGTNGRVVGYRDDIYAYVIVDDKHNYWYVRPELLEQINEAS